MIEPRDEDLSGIYRDAEARGPSRLVDDNILAASQRIAGARSRSAGAGFARRWGTPVALAATVLVTATLTLMVFERQSALDAMAPAAPRADRPAKVAPPEPKRTESSPADALEKSSPAEVRSAAPPEKSSSVDLPRAAPEPAAPSPQTTSRRDTRTVETALSSKRSATAPLVPESPRAPEVLRRREEAKPAPAAAPAANLSSERAGVGQRAPVPDAQRAFDVQQQMRPTEAPAPATAAGGLRESTPAVPGAGVVGGIASRPAVPDAKERTPEKWLEDIRQLKTEGKATEVERELAEFKKRYPDYRLPEDLR